MKKKIAVIIFIILIILVAIFVGTKIINKKTNYEIQDVEIYKYVKYRKNDKYGVMDRDGNIITEAKFTKIEIPNPEKDVFICYESEDKSIVLNSSNQVLFKEYSKIEPIKLKNIASTLSYEKSALKYEKDGLYGLIDFNGKELTKNEYSAIENLQSTEGKFLVSKDSKFGVINSNGAKLVDTKYDKVATDSYYAEDTKYEYSGFIVSNTTEDGYRYGYVDYKGNTILDIQYGNIIRIANEKEIYLIASKNGKYGVYRGKKEIIKPEYQSISYTDNGALIIEKNENFGIANLKGDIKVSTKYKKIEENGIYLYAENAKENTVYNSDGEKVDINFNKTIYKTKNDEYRITTLINNNIMYYGIENKEGKELVNEKYSYIEYIYDKYFIAQNEDEKYGVIDANGNKKIDFEYDLIQQVKGKNIIQAEKKENKNVEFYGKNIEKAADMKSARVENKTGYIRIYNDKKEVFLDIDGKEITKESEIVKKELEKEMPSTIGEYTKVQYSLEDAYYMKKQ